MKLLPDLEHLKICLCSEFHRDEVEFAFPALRTLYVDLQLSTDIERIYCPLLEKLALASMEDDEFFIFGTETSIAEFTEETEKEMLGPDDPSGAASKYMLPVPAYRYRHFDSDNCLWLAKTVSL